MGISVQFLHSYCCAVSKSWCLVYCIVTLRQQLHFGFSFSYASKANLRVRKKGCMNWIQLSFVQTALLIPKGNSFYCSGCCSSITEHVLPVDLGENKLYWWYIFPRLFCGFASQVMWWFLLEGLGRQPEFIKIVKISCKCQVEYHPCYGKPASLALSTSSCWQWMNNDVAGKSTVRPADF